MRFAEARRVGRGLDRRRESAGVDRARLPAQPSVGEPGMGLLQQRADEGYQVRTVDRANGCSKALEERGSLVPCVHPIGSGSRDGLCC